jgi:hypothetical protein
MSEEDKETDSERVKPLEVKPIKDVEGTVNLLLSAKKEKDTRTP